MSQDKRPYRLNAGAILLRGGKLLMGERVNQPDSWQFPQGGVDKGESVEEAMWRELSEELGLEPAQGLCRLRGQGPATRYDFPASMNAKIARKYRGQEQTLFVLDFLGQDEDFRLDAHDTPEFQALRWVSADEAVSLLWEVKRPILLATLRALPELFPGWSGATS